MVFENVVAQMLTASGHKLYFYSNSSRENKDERMEIDILIAKKIVKVFVCFADIIYSMECA